MGYRCLNILFYQETRLKLSKKIVNKIIEKEKKEKGVFYGYL